jgi:hypothetical protein
LPDHSECHWMNWISPEMLFRAFWLSTLPFQHFTHCPALGELLTLNLHHMCFYQRLLYPHSPPSIYPSLHSLKCEFLIFSSPEHSFWIMSCTSLPLFGSFLRSRCTWVHSLDGIMVSTAWLIWSVYLVEVVNRWFSECCP